MNLKRVSVIIAALVMVLGGASCSVLSEKQLQRIENLAIKADTLTSTPSAIFNTLAEIRLERGVFYAASLTTPQVRFDEIQAVAEGAIEDKKRAAKADVYIGILNSYFKALKSVAHTERWESVGREFRGLGRGIDSLIIEHNKLFGTDIPEGVSKTAGKAFGYIGENINKFRQTKYVKEFVAFGDTLVAECTDSLTSILKSKTLGELIDNESAGLEANYKAYIYAMSQGGYPPQIAHDREYVALVEKMSSVRQIRNRAVSALRAVKNAHHKLLLELREEDQDKDVYEDFETLNRLFLEINDTFSR